MIATTIRSSSNENPVFPFRINPPPDAFGTYSKLRGEKPTVYNNGEQTRDFVFIDDVCGAFLKSIENESAHNKILNIGTGIETSILQIIKLLGIKDYGVGKRQDDHIYSKMGDLDYTKRYLKWSPTTTLEEGIKQTISWGEEIHGQEKSNTTKIR